MLNLRRVASPLYEPISVDDALMHARIDNDVERSYVIGLIRVAREYVEDVTWRTLMGTEWDVGLDSWPNTVPPPYAGVEQALALNLWPVRGGWGMPRAPLRSVTSITYVDDTGGTNTFPLSNIVVDTLSEPGRISLKRSVAWPSVILVPVGAIKIRFVAGYSDVLTNASTPEQLAAARAACPAAAIHAIKLIAAHLYENREETVTGTIIASLPMGVDALLSPLRAMEF